MVVTSSQQALFIPLLLVVCYFAFSDCHQLVSLRAHLPGNEDTTDMIDTIDMIDRHESSSISPGRDDADDSGGCRSWTGTLVAESADWEEPHCRRCHCDVTLGAVCRDPPCPITFHPYLEDNCEQWSADGCCCQRSRCVHDGVRYSADDWFPLTPADPCTLCKCDPSDGLPRCLETACPDADCADVTHVPGECCPVCVQGRNCGLPDLLLGASNDSVADVTPVLYSSWRLVTLTLDANVTWNCTCAEAGKTADCNAWGEDKSNTTRTV